MATSFFLESCPVPTPSSCRDNHPEALQGGRRCRQRRRDNRRTGARADVTVDGQDILGVTLTLQAGMLVSGRIQFEGTSAPPPDLSRLRINLFPVQSPGEVSLGQIADPGGRERSVLDHRRRPRTLPSDGIHPVTAARCERVAAEVLDDTRPGHARPGHRPARGRRQRGHHVHRPHDRAERLGAGRGWSAGAGVSRGRVRARQDLLDGAVEAHSIGAALRPTASTRFRTCRPANT